MSEVPLYSSILSKMHSWGGAYRGTSLIRNTPLLRPCSMAMSNPLAILGGGTVSYERGTLVLLHRSGGGPVIPEAGLQGHLAHKKPPPSFGPL